MLRDEEAKNFINKLKKSKNERLNNLLEIKRQEKLKYIADMQDRVDVYNKSKERIVKERLDISRINKGYVKLKQIRSDYDDIIKESSKALPIINNNNNNNNECLNNHKTVIFKNISNKKSVNLTKLEHDFNKNIINSIKEDETKDVLYEGKLDDNENKSHFNNKDSEENKKTNKNICKINKNINISKKQNTVINYSNNIKDRDRYLKERLEAYMLIKDPSSSERDLLIMAIKEKYNSELL